MIEDKLTKWFGAPEVIDGNGRCPGYLRRWAIVRLFHRAIYIHKFSGNDWSKDLHDHPRRFVSIGLYGKYTEYTENRITVFSAPWIRSFPAEHKHRICMEKGQVCWTLCIIGRITRKWGFWHSGVWTFWKTFVESTTADEVKDC